MGGWYIDKKLTNQLIKTFHEKNNLHRPGAVGKQVENKKKKKSTDMAVSPLILKSPFRDYVESVIACAKMYYKKYKFADTGVAVNGIFTNYNIQWYKPGEGYYIWHSERTDYHITGDRHLVFMTYLNTCKAAGTMFYYQNKTFKCKKGDTLIWPAAWTHTHKGQISTTETKYIITGWYCYG